MTSSRHSLIEGSRKVLKAQIASSRINGFSSVREICISVSIAPNICLSLMVRIAFQRTSIEVSFSSSDNVLRAEVELIKQNHTTSLTTSRCRSNKRRVIPAFFDATAEVGDYH